MQPDDSTRLRLVEVRAAGGVLHVGGGFAAVLTAPAARSAVARRIATTVVGPRPADLDGTVEIAGRLVSARSLPSPLLPPSAPSLVGRELIRSHWSRACTRRLAALECEHSERARALERAEQALAAARRRAERERAAARERLEREAEAREEVRRLLGALDDLAPVPSPEASLLAEEWERHVGDRDALDALRAAEQEVEAARVRVRTARIALAVTTRGVAPDVRRAVEALHRAVVEAEANIDRLGRRAGTHAHARLASALRDERAALAAAGFDSYASYLVSVVRGHGPGDPPERTQALLELAAAEAALEGALAEAVARREARQARTAELRARATRLLGRVPAEDVAADLRALRVEHPDAVVVRDALATALAGAGVDPGDDPVVAAADFLANAGPSAATPATGADAEVDALRREVDVCESAVERVASERARLLAAHAGDAWSRDPDHAVLALTELLAAYRRGDVLGGRLPLVVDGAFDALPEPVLRAVMEVIAAARDVQPVVVTDDAAVFALAGSAGAQTSRWWEPRIPPERVVHGTDFAGAAGGHGR